MEAAAKHGALMAAIGPRLPTWALRPVVSYLWYTAIKSMWSAWRPEAEPVKTFVQRYSYVRHVKLQAQKNFRRS